MARECGKSLIILFFAAGAADLSYFQLQFGIESPLPCEMACCWVPSASMLHICAPPFSR